MEPTSVRRRDAARARIGTHSLEFENALARQTVVLTLDGALPVEYLSAGDRVITRDSGMAVLRRVNMRSRATHSVQFQAGSLGHDRPDSDTILPASQQVLIRDWRAEALFGAKHALVPALRLVDGEFVRDLGSQKLDFFELIFDAPHIIYADGLEIASAVALVSPTQNNECT